MLRELRIRNFAIIDELKVRFSPGLNVITGETGAGKSIIIGALGLVLGGRSSLEHIRDSEESSSVEAIFDLGGDPEIRGKLAEMDVDGQDEVVVRRVSSRSGKSRAYLNGCFTNLAYLNELGEYLVNICGQHEHQLVLDSRNHIRYLDSFGGLEAEQGSYSAMFENFQEKRANLCELEGLQREKLKKEEFLRFQLRELESANIQPGEDAALMEEKNIKGNVRRLTELAGLSYEGLYEANDSALSRLGQLYPRLEEIRRIDPSFQVNPGDVDSVRIILEDVSLTIREYLKNLSFDPGRLQEIEERLELIKSLKRRYGGSVESLIESRQALESELAQIASLDGDIEAARREITSLKKELMEKALLLSGKRKKAAESLKDLIEREVHDLRMEGARFEVRFRERSPGEVLLDGNGVDEVEFLISANQGQSPKPLARVASGGELSRVMLALKKILAGIGRAGTLVFDEVDAGIGGAAAEAVGGKLAGLAKSHQVICITHLPQIACFGQTHFVVSKSGQAEVTGIRVERLSEAGRLDEITRMMSGIEKTEKAREYAREMLETAAHINSGERAC